MKENTKKKIGSIVFMLVNIGIVAGLAVAEFTKTEGEIKAVHFRIGFIFCALGCFIVAMICETVKYFLMMRRVNPKTTFLGAFEIAAYGKYYDNITPLGAGGQPFQALALRERGFDNGSSVSIPVVGFLALQIAFSVMAVLVFILGGKAMPLPGIRVAAYIGLGFYLFLPAVILFFSIFPKALSMCVEYIVRFLGNLRIVKDPPSTCRKTINLLTEYRESLASVWREPLLPVLIFLLSVLYQAVLFSMPYFVLHAFGSRSGFFEIFFVTVFIYAAITFVPTPGNSGAAEGTFYMLFSSLSGGHLFWAMITWRFFCYYSFLIVGLVLQACRIISGKREEKLKVR